MAKKRKSRSRELEDKRQKRVRLFMGVFIVAIMVLSSFAFVIVFYSSGGHSAGGTSFDYEIRDNQIITEINGNEVPFYSLPDPNIHVPPEAISLMKNAQILVFLFDPTDEVNLPYTELVRWDISNYVEVNPAAALLEESDAYRYPVATCDKTDFASPYLQVINGTFGISVEGSCITMSGQQTDLLLLRDQLLYSYYGIS